MASSFVSRHPTQCNATWYDVLDLPEPAAATDLPAVVKHAGELEFDDTDVTALFKKKSYKVYMCIGITPNTSRPAIKVFDTGV